MPQVSVSERCLLQHPSEQVALIIKLVAVVRVKVILAGFLVGSSRIAKVSKQRTKSGHFFVWAVVGDSLEKIMLSSAQQTQHSLHDEGMWSVICHSLSFQKWTCSNQFSVVLGLLEPSTRFWWEIERGLLVVGAGSLVDGCKISCSNKRSLSGCQRKAGNRITFFCKFQNGLFPLPTFARVDRAVPQPNPILFDWKKPQGDDGKGTAKNHDNFRHLPTLPKFHDCFCRFSFDRKRQKCRKVS